jgi:hypothetical protein
MEFQNYLRKTALLAFAFVLMGFAVSYAHADDDDYSFKVHNNTKSAIKKILVSPDGKDYGFFDIGNGIAPGQTVELVWDKSTNGESCVQHFKAVFADGSESQPVKFDFCEDDLELSFD